MKPMYRMRNTGFMSGDRDTTNKMRNHGQYENEVEKPALPMEGRLEHGMGCHDFKGEADPIAYGQAMGEGCKSDMRKVDSQMKHYHWD